MKNLIFSKSPKLFALSNKTIEKDLKFLINLHEKKEIEFKKENLKIYSIENINDAFEERKRKKEKIILKL